MFKWSPGTDSPADRVGAASAVHGERVADDGARARGGVARGAAARRASALPAPACRAARRAGAPRPPAARHPPHPSVNWNTLYVITMPTALEGVVWCGGYEHMMRTWLCVVRYFLYLYF